MNIKIRIGKILLLVLDKPFWISAVTGGEGVPDKANVSSKILLPSVIVVSYIVRYGLQWNKCIILQIVLRIKKSQITLR